ncbi:MAG: hypothetical protein WC389_17265 [Lutibacter sp.]|jgi:hypothetical protein
MKKNNIYKKIFFSLVVVLTLFVATKSEASWSIVGTGDIALFQSTTGTCLSIKNDGTVTIAGVSPTLTCTAYDWFGTTYSNQQAIDFSYSQDNTSLPSYTGGTYDFGYTWPCDFSVQYSSACGGSTQTTIFSFIDPAISGATKGSLQTTVISGTSNLWPLMLIILGILLTFYILDKIIKLFSFKKKESDKQFIDKIGTKEPFFNNREEKTTTKKSNISRLNLIAPEYSTKSKKKGGNIF